MSSDIAETESGGGHRRLATAASVALIVACYGVLVAQWMRPSQVGRGALGYLLGLLFVLAAITALVELVGAFVWSQRLPLVRGALLGVAALVYALS